MGLQFEWTVNVGHILVFLGMVGGVIGLYYTMRSDIQVLNTRLASVEEGVKKMVELMIMIGRQDERLNAMDRRLEEIRK